MNNLYLVGMMGSGKSVTGKKLASLLQYSFVDLDQWIEEREKCSITEIFEKKGEEFFREIEAWLLKEISSGVPRVIATGGGAVLRRENVTLMRGTGKIIFLETSPDVLWQRVKHKKDRPLLRGADPEGKLRQIFSYRQALYEQASDLKVNTDGQTAEAVAEKILIELRKQS